MFIKLVRTKYLLCICVLVACSAPERALPNTRTPNADVASDAELVARGSWLTRWIGCVTCHSNPLRNENPFSGGFSKMDWGSGQVPNITPDLETGIGSWTDKQIIELLRLGNKPDGTRTGHPMAVPALRYLADDDARAIVAFLRTVKPVRNKLARLKRFTPGWSAEPAVPATVDRNDPPKYGQYLVRIGRCTVCHSQAEKGRHPYDLGAFQGTRVWAFRNTPYGSGEITAINLTPDKETGIGSWSDDRLMKGIWHHPNKLLMFIYTNWAPPWDGPPLVDPGIGFRIPEREMKAVVAYFRSLPAVRHAIPRRTLPRPGFEDFDKVPLPDFALLDHAMAAE